MEKNEIQAKESTELEEKKHDNEIAKTEHHRKKKDAVEVIEIEEEKKREKPKRSLAFMPYLLIILSVLLFLIIILDIAKVDTGILGDAVGGVLKGLFGWGFVAIPFYLLAEGIYFKKDRENSAVLGRIILCIINFVFILVLVHFITIPDASRNFEEGEYKNIVSRFWNDAVENNVGSGVIGSAIANVVYSLVKSTIGYIISIIAIFITTVFICGTTPLAVFKAIYRAIRNIHNARVARSTEKKAAKEEAEKERKAKEEEERKAKEEEEKKKRDEEEKIRKETDEKLKLNGTEPIEIPVTEVTVKTTDDDPLVTDDTLTSSKGDTEPPFPNDAPNKNGVHTYVFDGTGFTDIGDGVDDSVHTGDGKHVDDGKEEITDVNTETDETPQIKQYILPSTELLTKPKPSTVTSDEAVAETGRKLIDILKNFDIDVTLVSTNKGPTFTRYNVLPALGIRAARIEALKKDLRIHLAAKSIRVDSETPGEASIGIEVPNKDTSTVCIRSLIESDTFKNNPSKLFVALGVDVTGRHIYFDLAKMPHLLVAGATGMGKSVVLNCIIMSLLFRATPDEVKFILVDPKKVEFSSYDGLPHLLIPVVTTTSEAIGALTWAVDEMERRYNLLKEHDARNLIEYNQIISDDPEAEKMPYIVIIIDEFADLMATAKLAVEGSLQRLAAKARAAGIHIILATQRPAADVVSGNIKSNITSKIALACNNAVDSHIILGTTGAETLLGKGDMLFSPISERTPLRVQGAYVEGLTEVRDVCNFIRSQASADYSAEACDGIAKRTEQLEKSANKQKDENDDEFDGEDSLFIEALKIAYEYDTMSTSLLQRKLHIGYSRAQSMIDMMEERKYVSSFDPATKKRSILLPREQFEELIMNREDNREKTE